MMEYLESETLSKTVGFDVINFVLAGFSDAAAISIDPETEERRYTWEFGMLESLQCIKYEETTQWRYRKFLMWKTLKSQDEAYEIYKKRILN